MAAEARSPAAIAAPAQVDVKPTIIRRPSLLMKPAQSPPATTPPTHSPSGSLSLTSKEWVVPPRPKPGRKPATDTPPSKRKAQNRAAQRAFRERRAARVSELEDQIKQIDDENEREQDDMKTRISIMEREIDQYRIDLAHWMDRAKKLEQELNALRAKSHPKHDVPNSSDTSVGCGKCTLDSRCQCIDDVFDSMTGETSLNPPTSDKRAHSSAHARGGKRIKTEPNDSLEIDFTAMYAKPSTSRHEHVSAPVVTDPCGFCSDGTPCICAEMAAEQERSSINTRSNLARSDGPHQISEFTPPPSEGDVSMSLPKPASCANGPGTCAQCRADPNSTLFCKSLAASRSQSQGQSQTSGCCGGKTPGGSCCSTRTTRSQAAAASSSEQSQKSTVTLSCADAYTTLSRHPYYERSDIATWLPKLYASDSTKEEQVVAGGVQGRPAMEIDAANVMAVLKDFDRRFGRNA
jgi:TolA-binding protein